MLTIKFTLHVKKYMFYLSVNFFSITSSVSLVFSVFSSGMTRARIFCLSSSVVAGCVVPYVEVHSVLALAQTCRHFRALLREERIWHTLHARDHPHIESGRADDIVRDALNRVRAALLKEDVSLCDFRQAHEQLGALWRLLSEADDEILQPRRRLPGDVGMPVGSLCK